MPAPNRSGGRRGGSYSRQRATSQRGNGQRGNGQRGNGQRSNGQRGNGQRGSQSARGGYGGGRSSGGNDQMPLYIGLGVGAVVLVGVLAFLLMSGGGEDTVPVAENPQPEAATPAPLSGSDGPAPDVLHPFSARDKTLIRDLIEELDKDYDRAKELKDEGFVAQNRQDYDAAQKAWQEAHRLLSDMDRSSNDLERQFGEGVWERIERFLPTQDRTLERWGKLKSDITKHLNMLR